MKKQFTIVGALILFISLMIAINISNQKTREVENIYINNSIIKPLLQWESFMISLENRLSEIIEFGEIELVDVIEIENIHEVTTRYFYELKNNYNDLVRDNTDLTIRGGTYSDRMIDVGNNIQRLKTLLESRAEKEGYKVEGELIELINGSRLFISGYNAELEVLERINFENIKKKDFYENKFWQEFIHNLDKPLIIKEQQISFQRTNGNTNSMN